MSKPFPDRPPDQFSQSDLVLKGDAGKGLMNVFIQGDRGDHHAFPRSCALFCHKGIILQYHDTVQELTVDPLAMPMRQPTTQPLFAETERSS